MTREQANEIGRALAAAEAKIQEAREAVNRAWLAGYNGIALAAQPEPGERETDLRPMLDARGPQTEGNRLDPDPMELAVARVIAADILREDEPAPDPRGEVIRTPFGAPLPGAEIVRDMPAPEPAPLCSGPDHTNNGPLTEGFVPAPETGAGETCGLDAPQRWADFLRRLVETAPFFYISIDKRGATEIAGMLDQLAARLRSAPRDEGREAEAIRVAIQEAQRGPWGCNCAVDATGKLHRVCLGHYSEGVSVGDSGTWCLPPRADAARG